MSNAYYKTEEYQLNENATYKTQYSFSEKLDGVLTTSESVKYNNKDGASLIVEFENIYDYDSDVIPYHDHCVTISTLKPRHKILNKLKKVTKNIFPQKQKNVTQDMQEDILFSKLGDTSVSFQEYVLGSFDEKEYGPNVVKLIKKAQEDIAKARLVITKEHKLEQAKKFFEDKQKEKEASKQSELKREEAEKNALEQIIAQKAKDFNIR
ncbi:MAG: hypothetical protein J5896_05810 [Alphaproteobacteria bacterium]|nr:hypothetical protein [Alphaproteobacteria bacterium]